MNIFFKYDLVKKILIYDIIIVINFHSMNISDIINAVNVDNPLEQ